MNKIAINGIYTYVNNQIDKALNKGFSAKINNIDYEVEGGSLISWLYYMPVDTAINYFCYVSFCETCPYGRKKGICCDNLNVTFWNTMRALHYEFFRSYLNIEGRAGDLVFIKNDFDYPHIQRCSIEIAKKLDKLHDARNINSVMGITRDILVKWVSYVNTYTQEQEKQRKTLIDCIKSHYW